MKRRGRRAAAAAPISIPRWIRLIDNGNHLVLSGNQAVHRYLSADRRRGTIWRARPRLFRLRRSAKPARAGCSNPIDGPLPWWLAARSRRVPGTGARDYLPYAKLMFAGRKAHIADVVPVKGAVWDRLMRPFLLAALNTEPETASAQLAGAGAARDFGARAAMLTAPASPRPTLAAAFIDPALAFLERKGAKVELGNAAARPDVRRACGAGAGISRRDGAARPPGTWWCWRCRPGWPRNPVPDLTAPNEFRAIVNAPFPIPGASRRAAHAGRDRRHGGMDFLVSRTASRSRCRAPTPSSTRTARSWRGYLWRDVAPALRITDALPRWQIVKEKRATFAATPEQDCQAAARQNRVAATCSWPATGPIPACPPPSKARCARVKRRRLWRSSISSL